MKREEMSCYTFLSVHEHKSCPIYQIGDASGAILRKTPDTSSSANVIDFFPSVILVERLDDKEYPDLNPESFEKVTFYHVLVSYEPLIHGYMAARIERGESNVDHILIKTVTALQACKIIGTKKVCLC